MLTHFPFVFLPPSCELQGKMASLFINDLDAGAGRMGESTQYTVNNQMVNATLMNIADNPTNVQLPGVYKDADVARVPIVCTGAPPSRITRHHLCLLLTRVRHRTRRRVV